MEELLTSVLDFWKLVLFDPSSLLEFVVLSIFAFWITCLSLVGVHRAAGCNYPGTLTIVVITSLGGAVGLLAGGFGLQFSSASEFSSWQELAIGAGVSSLALCCTIIPLTRFVFACSYPISLISWVLAISSILGLSATTNHFLNTASIDSVSTKDEVTSMRIIPSPLQDETKNSSTSPPPKVEAKPETSTEEANTSQEKSPMEQAEDILRQMD